ncbi:MAG: hypothetical protein A4E45_00557 [Methanosaeta sp. PtaB.Bin039]|nr:MAG: hypothetical protein A4E45_00557 [Methanosaeta sp. PtaB.Bin039]
MSLLYNSALIGIYFMAFAMLHSTLAGSWAKEYARRRWSLFGRRYRILYNLAAVATAIPLVMVLLFLEDRILYLARPPWLYLALAIQAGAMLSMAYSLKQMGASQFLGLAEEAAGEGLVVRGLFCRVRNPLFLFATILIWATPVMTWNLLTMNLLITAYFYLGSVLEERRLSVQLGGDYQDYRRSVPRFIPRPGRCYRQDAHFPSSRGPSRR